MMAKVVTTSEVSTSRGYAGGQLNWLASFYRSTLGKKIVMAVTGFIGFGYVVVHMVGNLQMFLGAEKINAYGALLKSNDEVLWTARTVLLAAVVLHVVAAYQLARTSQKSRPVHYVRWRAVQSTIASRTMRWSGPVLLIFIVFHLLHFTTGTVHPSFREGDVYENVVTGFSVWYVAAFYIIAMLALGFHLFHGVWSMFQTLGADNPRYNGPIRKFATIITLAVVIGFTSIPVAVLLGVLF
jgi:succinate dehydrogenase / fumarate reductase cytochrome b subunit